MSETTNERGEMREPMEPTEQEREAQRQALEEAKRRGEQTQNK